MTGRSGEHLTNSKCVVLYSSDHWTTRSPHQIVLPMSFAVAHNYPPSAAPAKKAFRPAEWAIVRRCRTPKQVQEYLRRLPYNWEKQGETLRTFRGVVKHGSAHCLEGALSAATIMEQHGYPPLLLELGIAGSARPRSVPIQEAWALGNRGALTGCGPARAQAGLPHPA